MDPLLSVENLRVEFAMRRRSVVAVSDMTLEIAAGERVGIVGESGCGKTTTGMAIMRLLAGNGAIAGGRIVLDGVDLASLSEDEMQKVRGNGIALIPQDPLTCLNPTMRIGRQIGEGYRIHRGASQHDADRRAIEVLEMVEMPHPEERLRQYPFELSGGLRQRVMIAMGLVCEPKLLIADEPTTALDVTIQAQILNIFDHLCENLGMAVLLITHDMGVIASRTDRVVVMYAGQKAEEAPTETLFARMRHPYTQALLASVPSLEQVTKATLKSIAGLPPDLSQDITGCKFAPRCVYATDECRSADPGFSEDGDDHRYRCFHPVDGPLPVEVAVPVAAAARPVAAAHDELLRVENLEKGFPVRRGLFARTVATVHAVSGISFSVRDGETFGLVGESGCGKTTVGRLIVGLEPVTAGTISFQGRDVTSLKGADSRAIRQERQMMFQDPYASLNPRMRVRDIIREPLKVQHLGTKDEQIAKVEELLVSVGLNPKVGERHPHEFSGGQRQRIGLARALALDPRLIIADEPVSALDVSIQAQMLNLMKELQVQRGLSFIMVSHDLAVVYYMADTIGVMYLGKLVEIGDAESVFRSPAHPYTQGLLDAVPIPDPERARRAAKIQVFGELPSATAPPSGCRFRTRCPRAQEVCAEEEPPLVAYGPNHQAACHFPLRSPVALSTSTQASTAPR